MNVRFSFDKFLVFLALLSFLAVGVASAQTESSAQAQLVHFGDLIEVDVVGSYDYDWRGTITPEGFLDGLDYLEEQVFALCRSEGEISTDITRQYGKILRDPKVHVRILDRSNRAVAFVNGAVRSPQRFQIKRPVYLNELLVLTGGITDRSSGDISIFRPPKLSCTEPKKTTGDEFVKASQPGGAETINIRISEILRGEPTANPQILSGDIVTVSEALPVYRIGGVNTPQQIPIRNQLTLSRAIATAGGLAKEGVSSVTIFRREGRETKVIPADLEKIAAGAEDPVLKPFDVVDVPLKGKPPRARPPVIENRQSSSLSLVGLPLRIVD
ncbi:MAG TPA: SLBB domain-containing protein [Pyrinomonadaceae bacterium]|nr:SLBB domain-containing protein [Pyrinomonadaceae bacterium]